MAWTYSGNPSSTAKDAVRFIIGDTDTSTAYVTDEEIAWALNEQNQNSYLAAAIIAEGLSFKFATMSDAVVGPIRVSYAQRAQNYAALVKRLRQISAQKSNLEVYAGGISISDIESQEADTDRVDGPFDIGMNDYQDNDDSLTES